jgi:hypothetical protein
MKIIRKIVLLLLFVLFVPKVYAFTYEMDMNVDKTSVSKDSVKEITVSLKNIKDTSDGIMACSLDLKLSDGMVIEPDVRTLNNWSMTKQNIYLFDTGTPILNESKMFIIPVKVSKDGMVELTNIKCSDGVSNSYIENQSVKFTILKESTNVNNKVDNNNNENGKNETGSNDPGETNCNLSNIELSEGVIEFDSEITEYSVKVKDFDTFEVNPILESANAEFIIDKNLGTNNKHSVVITVNSQSGDTKVYTIYVEEIVEEQFVPKKNNNYVPIFIVIICLLVLINVLRIVKNKNK